MLDDTTLREVFHVRVSAMSAITMLSVIFIVLIVLLSVLIVYTPIRNILPGYSASIREQLVDASARVDSLQLVERAEILEMNSEVTDAFMAQYEQKERDRLMLFDNATNRTVRQLARPVRGVIVQSAAPIAKQYGTVVRTSNNENVLAVTHGTIISTERMADNTFAVVLQNGAFMAIYRHVPKLLKEQGAHVEKGETIGLTNAEYNLVIEIWEDGQFVNPEEVIVW